MKIAIHIQPCLIVLFIFASHIGIAQSFDWVQTIGSISGDAVNTMALDKDGNVYITGRFFGEVDFGNRGREEDTRTSVNENADAFFAKYNPAGELVFVRKIFSDGQDNGVGIRVDRQGNIYVSGVYNEALSFETSIQKPLPWIGDNDIYVAKYTAAGEFVFAFRIGGLGNDRLPYFDVDNNENIYITGEFDTTLSFFSSDDSQGDKKDGIGQKDLFLAKYDSEGKWVFSKQIGGTDNDSPGAIRLDSRSNIYIAGNIASDDFDPDQSTTRDNILKSKSNRNDIFIAKYNSDGEYIIAKSMGGIDAESPNGMHVDAAGNVYLTGRTDKNADFDPDETGTAIIGEHNQDGFYAKYFPDLTFAFAKSFGNDDAELDRGLDIDVDSEGNIYIAGDFNSSMLNLNPQNADNPLMNRGAGNSDGFLAKFTPDGEQLLFVRQIGGDGSDIGKDIAVDSSGNIYSAGEFESTVTFDASKIITADGERDFYIIKYSADITLKRRVATNVSGNLHAADLDGDGALDIISANGPEADAEASSITWYKNDGQGNFTLQPIVADNIQIPKSIFGVDLDNDGDRDILAANRADNHIVWYENQGNSFVKNAAKVISDALLSPISIFPADLDGDGDLDVLVASRDDGKVTWFENRLNEESKDFTIFPVDDAAESAQSVFAVDVDGDGDLDALAAHRRNKGQISWYENTAVDETTRALTLKEEVNLGGAEFVSAADFNNDGTPEIIGVSSNKISIYTISGGAFSTPKELSGINGGEAVSMADLDGDGDLDIVSASFNDNKIAWYENLGKATANFGAQQIINLTAEGTRIVLTPDLDNDGRADVLWAAETINEIAWAKNLLFTPANPSITTFFPASSSPGNTFTIYGTNFGSAPKVFFESNGTSIEALSVTPDNSGGVEKLIVVIPESLPLGPYKIKVTDAAKVVISVDDLLIPTLAIPQVTALNPSAGPVGTTLTITGKSFGSDATKVQVKFGDAATLPVDDTELISTTEISITVPELEENTYPIAVVVGTLTSNNDKTFTVTSPDGPVISSLSVTSGAPGGKVTITGQNFGADAGLVAVTFNETTADFELKSDTEIEVTVPELSGGLYNIKVTVDELESNVVEFTISGAPVTPSLTSIDPATITEGNTPVVTITGTGFGNNADNITVSFKNAGDGITDITSGINVTGGTEISFTVPVLAVGAYTVSVTVDATVSDNTLAFTVEEDVDPGEDPPLITEVPPFGNSEGQIIITGNNFGTDTNNTSVTFAGNEQSAAGSIVTLADDEIVVEIPDDLVEGEYDVTVAVSGKQTTFGNKFVIDNTPPSINATGIASAEYFVPGAAKEFTITVTDGSSGIGDVNLLYFGIRDEEGNAQTAPFTNNGDDTFTIDIQSLTITDELGMEFHLLATDNAGNASRFPNGSGFFLHKDQQNMSIPAAKASNADVPTISDYNLVAVPLDGITRDQVFGDLGTFGRNGKWWLFAYNAATQQYQEVTSPSLDPRKGYMLIFRDAASIQPQGKVLPVTADQPVTLSIDPGFNLIGNPFPFNMRWDDVVALNAGVPGIDQLKFRKFNKSSENKWGDNGNTFNAFTGALVINPTALAMTLEIPYKKANIGGRYTQDENKKKLQPLDALAWEVPLRIETAGRYTLGGLGMHPEATTAYDPLDDFTVPRFLDYLELNFPHPEFFLSKFAKDIVPTQDTYTWEFEVASNLASPEVTIRWENYYFGNNGQALMLLDLHNYQIIDMREATSYTFSTIESTRSFKVFFGDEEKVWDHILPESIAVREAFPNPMQDQLTIPVSLPGSANNHELTVEIYNTTGQLIKRISNENIPAGYHRLQWDRTNIDGQKVRSGLYFYRLKVNDQIYDGRVIAW